MRNTNKVPKMQQWGKWKSDPKTAALNAAEMRERKTRHRTARVENAGLENAETTKYGKLNDVDNDLKRPLTHFSTSRISLTLYMYMYAFWVQKKPSAAPVWFDRSVYHRCQKLIFGQSVQNVVHSCSERILNLWVAHFENPPGATLAPLRNFNNSRWRPRWLPSTLKSKLLLKEAF